jgi:hypothetical protein
MPTTSQAASVTAPARAGKPNSRAGLECAALTALLLATAGAATALAAGAVAAAMALAFVAAVLLVLE